ncbi:MAG: DUF1015 family protein [bacterium]|nr:DUF1015 family protein [bacterium]MDE0351805.1 DUF1015 family protein [bacterium]
MVSVIPVEALVTRSDRVVDVVAPQADSVPGGDSYHYAVDHPDSFLNVTLAVGEFPGPTPSREAVVKRASGHFRGMLERGLFEPLPLAAFFLYELDTGSHRQVGIVGGVSLAAIEEGRILGHEETLEGPVEDLAHFYRVARLSSSPVALGFDADEHHHSLMRELSSGTPLRDFTSPDGVRQRLWAVTDPSGISALRAAASRVETMYITDGHHRVAAARQPGGGPGWFLAIMFPNNHLRALAYNRVIVPDFLPSPEEVRRSLSGGWEMDRMGPAGAVESQPRGTGEIAMVLDGMSYRLVFRGRRPDHPVARLDVSLLHDSILRPVFGISSSEDPRLWYEVGENSSMPFESRVAAYPGAVGFAMHPAQIDEMTAVADARSLMPPKSTWFTPKPRSGLLVVRWEDQAAGNDPRAPDGAPGGSRGR